MHGARDQEVSTCITELLCDLRQVALCQCLSFPSCPHSTLSCLLCKLFGAETSPHSVSDQGQTALGQAWGCKPKATWGAGVRKKLR